ncbi:MAG: 3'(2'),5'-bisphosphate nucleotidase CysQ [Hyphomicrobiales bacterium]|nr:3'(2'),5'-bisphosphate nucleotidase CysQ [Hyphomicrobiales bacterium]
MLVAAVREAGALALKTFRGPLRQWIKGKASPVCEADIAVDALLRERLGHAFPDYGWLSEETEDDQRRLAAPAVWIVDPIDGTRSYLDGRDDWVISVALAVAGRPQLAAIYAPVTDEFFFAGLDEGATCNGAPIRVDEGSGLEGARLAGPKRFLGSMAELHPSVVPQPRIGSLALRLARVAHGQIDIAVVSGNSHDWDLAAADLLVHEAGGELTDINGERLAFNRPQPVHAVLVAASGARHASALALIRERRAQFM